MRHVPGRAALVAGLTCLLLASALVLTSANPAAPQSAPRAGTLEWSGCFRREARQARQITGDPTIRFQCAILTVPLDYDDPDGPTVDIAVSRLPARTGAELGSLIINPGGPGGSGVDFVAFASPYIYADDIRDQFDVVGFDPRGIGRSDVLQCFRRPDGIFSVLLPFPYPESRREIRSWRSSDQALADACDSRGGALLDHMSTANVARDMDLLREAVGDEQLTFQGFSYGTYLGVTYANLFPDRVRAMVVDGVLDPVAWSGLGRLGRQTLDQRLGSGDAANETLDQFFALCADAGARRCGLAPRPERRWNRLLAAAASDPITYVLETPDGEIEVTETDRTIVAGALGAMYNSGVWSGFADYLAFLEEQAGIGRRDAGGDDVRRAPYPERPEYPGIEGFPAVVCSEGNHPDNFRTWVRYNSRAEAPFGPVWGWGTSVCASWPAQDEDRYTGPYTAATSTPILVASTTFDPATPYSGALAVRDLAPGSVLVTVEGWGHTMFGLSRCGDRIVTDYLVSQTVPAGDQTCAQSINPFPAVGRGQTDRAADARDRLVKALLG
jgi:pimeloyl-ACP methyl ester carboxylesterase